MHTQGYVDLFSWHTAGMPDLWDTLIYGMPNQKHNSQFKNVSYKKNTITLLNSFQEKCELYKTCPDLWLNQQIHSTLGNVNLDPHLGERSKSWQNKLSSNSKIKQFIYYACGSAHSPVSNSKCTVLCY